MFINGRKRFLPFLYTFDSRNKGKGVKKQDKLQKVSRNGRKHFIPFLDTFGSRNKRKKVSGNRKNDKKCLEMGETQFLLFIGTFQKCLEMG